MNKEIGIDIKRGKLGVWTVACLISVILSSLGGFLSHKYIWGVAMLLAIPIIIFNYNRVQLLCKVSKGDKKLYLIKDEYVLASSLQEAELLVVIDKLGDDSEIKYLGEVKYFE